MPAEHVEMQRVTSEIFVAVSARRDEIDADDRASTIFESVEELWNAYNEADADADTDGAMATMRHVTWGLRTVAAILDNEPPPPLLELPKPERWAYAKLLVVAGSFRLLVAILLYEMVSWV